MAGTQDTPSGPNLAQGVAFDKISDGAMLAGQVDGEAVLVVRRGDEIFAVGATCTHYNGPLPEGILVGETVRCPWHHACFNLRTGAAVRAPAFAALPRWRVERRGDTVFVGEKLQEDAAPVRPNSGIGPERIVIVGGGAAGFAAAEMLRREGFGGGIAMLSVDEAPPCDRPNLSKDYLAGSAPEDWIPLRDESFYRDQNIDLHLQARVSAIDPDGQRVALQDGRTFPFHKLLLATGAEPVRLSIPGAELEHVRVLRTLADSRAIIDQAKVARRALVVGASFIGLEVAASLRARELEVHVVAPDHRPMERILGPEFGDFIQSLHEEHGVVFHLRQTVAAIEDRRVRLSSGEMLDTDLVVAGIGVRPNTELAGRAGLAIDRGVSVNQYLETSRPGVFAAGDIARWPDPHTGETLRIEHWVVAERQGQTAARNMLGYREPFAAVPFFWSQHYDVSIAYVGHAAAWDRLEADGDMRSRDCAVRYYRDGRVLALATIFRDVESLDQEVTIERAVVGAAWAKAAELPGAAPPTTG
jgi:NADPH-dependent 2,4-dienoyl-CoA reductase/sulfur reductase-like enzyme/nitrite reductase/ring-hydroxylating ferredoxin subunit